MALRANIIWALCFLPLYVLPAAAQTAPISLAWDYTTQGQDGFILARKTGQAGTYADLALPIGPAARTITDTTPAAGQIYCYRIAATLQTVKSPLSSEICGATLTAPLNLRIQ